MRISSGITGTGSSCSRGKTSRNHPTHPASERRAPRKLTETLVTSPANNKALPNARTKGQAVGAGTSILRGVEGRSLDCSFISNVAISRSSATKHVHNRKNNDPNRIHKMPVQRKHSDTMRVLPSDLAGKREDRHDEEHDYSYGDVECVQTYERVVGCPEEIGGDRQPALVDQPMPLSSGTKEKQATQQNRERPQA